MQLITRVLLISLAPILATPMPAAADLGSVFERVIDRATRRAEDSVERVADTHATNATQQAEKCALEPAACAAQTKEANRRRDLAAMHASTWYVELDGKAEGPLDGKQMEEMLTKRRLTSSTLVWKEGMSAWKAAAKVRELRRAFPKAPPALPGAPPLPAVSSR